jgi:hypothetical protein
MERIKKALEKARESQAIGSHALTEAVPAGSGDAPFCPAIVSPVQSATLERHRIIAGNKRDPHTAAIDRLRTQILREMLQNGWRILGVTSPTPACGKTTVAINLALSIAQQTTPNVILADFDFRRPKIADYLGIQPDHDLSDFLEGLVPATRTLVDPGIPRLLVLPNRRGHENATEMLTRREIRDLVFRLKTDDEERIIVVDLPPMLNTDDTIAFLPQVDCVLLVVADRMTKKGDVEAALTLLKGSNLIGTVLNKAEGKQLPYY